LRRRHAEDQHVLGEPAFVAPITDAIRSEALLPSNALPP
jgi:hypothetical protein